jgi:hypothetical protein
MGYRIQGNRIYTDAEWNAKCRNEWILDKLSNVEVDVSGLGKFIVTIGEYIIIAVLFIPVWSVVLPFRGLRWLYRRWAANRERPVLNLSERD